MGRNVPSPVEEERKKERENVKQSLHVSLVRRDVITRTPYCPAVSCEGKPCKGPSTDFQKTESKIVKEDYMDFNVEYPEDSLLKVSCTGGFLEITQVSRCQGTLSMTYFNQANIKRHNHADTDLDPCY